jgi:hypothetical protein
MTIDIETSDSLWAYCTANERLVPMPSDWTELHGMLANTRQKRSGGMGASLAADSGKMGLHDTHREATSVPVIFERGANRCMWGWPRLIFATSEGAAAQYFG